MNAGEIERVMERTSTKLPNDRFSFFVGYVIIMQETDDTVLMLNGRKSLSNVPSQQVSAVFVVGSCRKSTIEAFFKLPTRRWRLYAGEQSEKFDTGLRHL